jgi:hypothetical protein
VLYPPIGERRCTCCWIHVCSSVVHYHGHISQISN